MNDTYKKLFDYYENRFEPHAQSVINEQITHEADRRKLARAAIMINRVKKPIHIISRNYTLAPERHFENKTANVTYQAHQEASGLNVLMRYVEKMSNLLGTVAVGPYYSKGKIKYRTFLPHQYEVKASINDPTEMVEFSYTRFHKRGDEIKSVTYTWTDRTYEMKIGNTTKTTKNPFGVIPFVLFKKNYGQSLYGEFPADLLSVAEKMMVKTADLSLAIDSETLVMMFFYGVDGLSGAEEQAVRALERMKYFFVPMVTTMPGEGVPVGSPNAQILQPNAHLKEIWETIGYLHKEFLKSWHIPFKQYEEAKTPSSWAGLKFSSEDLYNEIVGRRDLYRASETELSKIYLIVHNVWAKNTDNDLTEMKDTPWHIEFAEIPEIYSEPVSLAVAQQKISLNMTSLVRELKKRKKGMTDDQVYEYLKQVKEENDKVDAIFGGPTVTQQEVNKRLLAPETEETEEGSEE